LVGGFDISFHRHRRAGRQPAVAGARAISGFVNSPETFDNQNRLYILDTEQTITTGLEFRVTRPLGGLT
jgi:hypothetical protein